LEGIDPKYRRTLRRIVAIEIEPAKSSAAKLDASGAHDGVRSAMRNPIRPCRTFLHKSVTRIRGGAFVYTIKKLTTIGANMQLTVLGCSGGIGGGRHTTCYLVDDDTLLDAGTGITTLTMLQLARIDQVFLTHSHLDHVLGLPLLLDTVGGMRSTPVTVYALPEVLNVLDHNLFNGKLWPDFRSIPSHEHPWLRFHSMPLGSSIRLGAREFTPLPVVHVVPACGWQLNDSGGSLVFSGDTTNSEAFIQALNTIPELQHLILETSFENAQKGIAVSAKHHCPDSVAHDLDRLTARPEVWIAHLKPGHEDAIMAELKLAAPKWNLRVLQNEQVIRW
jgi:ribonuclease BN (tRNA processing enzyme)